jgi:CRISPR-associated protein Cmr6
MRGDLPPVPHRGELAKLFGDRLLPQDSHPGLVFDRYLPTWGESRGQWSIETKNFQNEFASDYSKAKGRLGQDLELHHDRLDRALSDQQGLQTFELVTTSRLVLGLGADHPWENGFAFDHGLGVPVLPGSSLKGLARAWAEILGLSEEVIERLFGHPIETRGTHRSGDVVFLPAWPTEIPELGVDVINNHLPRYYRGEEAEALPLDDPIPINILVVEPGAKFRFRLFPRLGAPTGSTGDAALVLRDALENLGLGAKTAVGYGVFSSKGKSTNGMGKLEPMQMTPLYRHIRLQLHPAPDGAPPDPVAAGVIPEGEIKSYSLSTEGWLLHNMAPEAIDWKRISGEVRELARGARSFDTGIRPSETYAYGLAPLPAWFQLGLEWTAWGSEVTVANERRGVGWDRVSARRGDADSYFEKPILPEPNRMSGLIPVSLQINPGGSGVPQVVWEQLDRISRQVGSSLACESVVNIYSNQALTENDGRAAFEQLKTIFSQLPSRFPRQTGLMICLKGPVTLAWLAGLATNRNLYPTIELPYFHGGQYHQGLGIDLRGRP